MYHMVYTHSELFTVTAKNPKCGKVTCNCRKTRP